MSESLISRRQALITAFMKNVKIPVTTKECIDHMSSNGLGFSSENKSSILAATFAILTGMENEGEITRYKREGSRDIVWYKSDHLDNHLLGEGSPMRLYIKTNYDSIVGKTASQILNLMEKSSTDLKNYIQLVGDRKDVLAMLRGDITRISLYRENNVVIPAVTEEQEVTEESL